MSRIGSVPRDMDPVALRAMRRNFEDTTGRSARANMTKTPNVRTSQLQTADLGEIKMINQTFRPIGHPLGSQPVRIDIQPDNDAIVYVERTTDKMLYVTSNKQTNVRIRVFL
jgi:hypothetical protein